MDQYNKYSDPVTWLIGYFDTSRLSGSPHSEWYADEKAEYFPDPEAAKRLKELTDPGISIKIVMGTWCPDSRREVPRFMKVLEVMGFDREKVRFIGVDNMKISPIENYEALDIIRVPTFIIYRNNVETGRIIENPETSLEQDMIKILTRND